MEDRILDEAGRPVMFDRDAAERLDFGPHGYLYLHAGPRGEGVNGVIFEEELLGALIQHLKERDGDRETEAAVQKLEECQMRLVAQERNRVNTQGTVSARVQRGTPLQRGVGLPIPEPLIQEAPPRPIVTDAEAERARIEREHNPDLVSRPIVKDIPNP